MAGGGKVCIKHTELKHRNAEGKPNRRCPAASRRCISILPARFHAQKSVVYKLPLSKAKLFVFTAAQRDPNTNREANASEAVLLESRRSMKQDVNTQSASEFFPTRGTREKAP